ncbi:TetR/AcrR family transcriptional regulator [Amycolatopsis magusensis]|uniref:AcrR family transcriptional regulator n=1 Tax=Amycolatopsis magusensis TaxID=882444 RepID=A0ABS4PPV9_9PSEU|nr:TetR/AcrR family transcriptional regulator [Amycolatopsis magusensis]MBP2180656.1 AcrR family transcriptional regulator [Amycolatopsis magusensis]MDI5980466.1 TetR/AcrR family transcriptional regulator [Amycolatopsis magusensis]
MARPRTHDDGLRVRLLDRAGELLSGEGPGALSLRRLAKDAGTSTTAVYSLFGSKPDLISALYVEGFARFEKRLAAIVRTGDHFEDLVSLGLAYRASALADPHMYSIMFTKAVPGFEPDESSTELARSTMNPLLETIRAGIAEGVFTDEPAERIAASSWGIAHGMVSLEINGNLPPGFDVSGAYEAALRANGRGWLRTV